MIKRKSRKNPYNIGYTFTSSDNVKSILKKGLIPTKLFSRKDKDHVTSIVSDYDFDSVYKMEESRIFFIEYYIFNKQRPLFFTNSENIEEIIHAHLKDYIRMKNIMIKVDCSEYKQYPDYHTLIIDHYFEIFLHQNTFYFCINAYKSIISKDIYEYVKNKYNILFDRDLNRITKIRKNMYAAIPFDDLSKDDLLNKMFIDYTNCFCINNKIPSDRILEIKEIIT